MIAKVFSISRQDSKSSSYLAALAIQRLKSSGSWAKFFLSDDGAVLFSSFPPKLLKLCSCFFLCRFELASSRLSRLNLRLGIAKGHLGSIKSSSFVPAIFSFAAVALDSASLALTIRFLISVEAFLLSYQNSCYLFRYAFACQTCYVAFQLQLFFGQIQILPKIFQMLFRKKASDLLRMSIFPIGLSLIFCRSANSSFTLRPGALLPSQPLAEGLRRRDAQ